MKTIYLDHNATTPVRPEVVEEMARCLKMGLANPSSAHAPGRRANQLLEEARRGSAELLGADLQASPPDRLLFTSGGTESNNLAILGIARQQLRAKTPSASKHVPGHVVVSSIEHASVVGPVERLMDEGWEVDSIPVGRDGRLQHDRLESLIGKQTCLVSATMANHETGVVQPVAELAAVCREAGVAMHTDAVQMAGKMPIEFRILGVAALSISAHKFGGPPGVGALVLRGDEELDPLFFSGEQQSALRPGTESVALARGLWTALRLAVEEQNAQATRLGKLRLRFEDGLRARIANIEVHGSNDHKLPQTANIAFPGINAVGLFHALDEAGIACSLGSACTSGSEEPSPTLLAMGLPMERVKASLRFSLGRTTTEQDIDEAVERIASVVTAG